MESSRFLQHLHESSLEEGRAYIQAHLADLADHDAVAKLLEDEALKLLYNPFPSLKLAELLIFYGEITGHLPSHALGIKAKGDALEQIRHHQAAIECLDIAGEEFLSLRDEGNWARSRISWMIAATSIGQVEEALEAAARAREIFARQGENYWVCVMDHNTAWIYKRVGRYQDASVLYERILTMYPTMTDHDETFIKRSIALAQVAYAINLSWLGQLKKAYKLLQEAQASFASLQETSMAANCEINLADLDYTLGYYGSSLRRYYHAQDILLQNSIDNPKTTGEIKLQIANTLVKLNRTSEACQLGYEAVEIYRQPGTSLHTSNTLLEYASILVADRRLKEALAALDEAKMLFDRGGFEHYASATRLQQAEIFLEMGAFGDAYDTASKIRPFFEAQGLVARSVRASMVMVSALIEQAQQAGKKQEREQQSMLLQQAVQRCKQAALQAHQHHLQEEVYKSQYLLGRIFALQGDLYKAKWHYGAAIAQIERILDDLVYDLSPSFLRTAWQVYEDMINLCLQQGQSELAFDHLERARSMALCQYLNRSKTQFSAEDEQQEDILSNESRTGAGIILQLQNELKTWQGRYRDYSALLANIATSVSSVVDQTVIQAEIKRCEAKISELFERLYLQQTTAQPMTHLKTSEKASKRFAGVAQLRRHLLPDQLLLAYFLSKERLIIFAATKNQLVTAEQADGAKQLRRLLPLLHASLQVKGWPDPQRPPQEATRQLLKKLYDLLIAPVASHLPPAGSSLTIVPYSSLHTLPFHALYDGSHFLIENFQVSYLPAASLLQSGIYEYEQQAQEMETTERPLIFGYSGRGHLQRALEEAKTLANLLNGRCYLEDEATITRLIAEAPDSPIIHVATHGHSRLDAPNFSSVLLADGRFNAIDAFSLDLKACELVTLSGCETGLALSGGGDEQLGLGRAFLAAGAKSLVMSLWPVEDNATGELMQRFYQHLLNGESKVQALRAAQCSLIQRTDTGYTHPYYWAAFRLVGNVAPLKYRQKESPSSAQEIEA